MWYVFLFWPALVSLATGGLARTVRVDVPPRALAGLVGTEFVLVALYGIPTVFAWPDAAALPSGGLGDALVQELWYVGRLLPLVFGVLIVGGACFGALRARGAGDPGEDGARG